MGIVTSALPIGSINPGQENRTVDPRFQAFSRAGQHALAFRSPLNVARSVRSILFDMVLIDPAIINAVLIGVVFIDTARTV